MNRANEQTAVTGVTRSAPSRRPTAVKRVAIAAVGIVIADGGEIARLRTAGGDGKILRNADEQTVLAVTAVGRAAADAGLERFDDWGVVAAPRWQGRFGTAAAMGRFAAVGVRGIAPNVIPNMCLHACRCHGQHHARGPRPGLRLRRRPVSRRRRFAGGNHYAVGQSYSRHLALLDRLGRRSGDRRRPRPRAGAGAGRRGRGGVESRLWPGPPRPTAGPARLTGLIDFLVRPAGSRWDHPLDGGGEISVTAEGAR